jgi:transcriptional regulator with XRE-family HTH domain
MSVKMTHTYLGRVCIIPSMVVRNDIIQREISKAIKRERMKQGKTQVQLASEAGILRTTLVNLESAKQGLSLESLYQLCVALGVQVSEILPPVEKVVGAKTTSGKNLLVKGKKLDEELGIDLADKIAKELEERT